MLQDTVPLTHDCDSDEAPEVVTKQSATEQAFAQQQQEKVAHAQAKAAKRKRKAKQETTEEDGIQELPDDVLSAIAARKIEEDAEESAAELHAKKRRADEDAKVAKLLEKKRHTRQFGNIQVQTLEALEKTQTRALSVSAKDFLIRRTAPLRARMNVMEGHPSQFTKKQKQRT